MDAFNLQPVIGCFRIDCAGCNGTAFFRLVRSGKSWADHQFGGQQPASCNVRTGLEPSENSTSGFPLGPASRPKALKLRLLFSMTLHHFGPYDGPVVDWFVSSQSEVGFGVVATQLSAQIHLVTPRGKSGS